MKKPFQIVVILCLLIFSLTMRAQFIIAGQHDSTDYYYVESFDFIVASNLNSNTFDSIDINGDGIADFQLSSGSYLGSGHPPNCSFGCGISGLNSNQIVIKNAPNLSLPNSIGDSMTMVRKFALNDTINSDLGWGDGNDISSYVCDTPVGPYYNLFITSGGYIGARIFIKKDTLYGWIKIDSVSDSGFILRSFACQSLKTTGLNNINNPLGTNVFPNPAQDKITLSISIASTYNLSLTSILGQLITKKQFSGTKTELDVSDLPKGIYFVNISNDQVKGVKKVIIQ